MRIKSRTVFFLLLLLFQPQLVRSQDPYRTTRSLEVQRAIGHVAQAEYYARMALRSLEASERWVERRSSIIRRRGRTSEGF